MELQSIGQVSKRFNISVRTLHYYEQIGLIKPTKNDDNAYRLYDEEIIVRLDVLVELGIAYALQRVDDDKFCVGVGG